MKTDGMKKFSPTITNSLHDDFEINMEADIFIDTLKREISNEKLSVSNKNPKIKVLSGDTMCTYYPTDNTFDYEIDEIFKFIQAYRLESCNQHQDKVYL